VEVSIGGGRIGAATSDEVVELTVAVERDEEVESLRDMPGDDPGGNRGKAGYAEGGVGGDDCGGVGNGVCRVVAIVVVSGDSK
jgi:hypothetical protein